MFFLIVIGVVYLYFPHKTQKLIYFPKKSNPLFKEYLLMQDTSLNSFDIYFLKQLDIKPGWIRVEKEVNKLDIMKLAQAKKSEKTRIMVAYGGENIDDFFTQIAKQANLNQEKLKEIFNKKALFDNASILAKKYHIPYRVDEGSVLNYMLANTLESYKKIAKENNISISSDSFYKKIVVASIIQKETSSAKEMPLIASVIYNRLKNDLKLQMDATLNYGKHSHTIITPKMIREDNSKFNTYKFKGLPPKPLAMVTINALEAAFNPKESEYLYFVKRGKSHIFSKNYKKHKKRVAIYKKSLVTKRLIKKEFRKVAYIFSKNLKPTIFTLYLPIKTK